MSSGSSMPPRDDPRIKYSPICMTTKDQSAQQTQTSKKLTQALRFLLLSDYFTVHSLQAKRGPGIQTAS